MKLNPKKQTIGVIWFILHCLFFSIISIISKILLNDLHVFEILFFQTSIGTLLLLPRLLSKHRAGLKSISYKMHIGRSFLWAMASALFFYSVTIIPVPKATAISFAVPLFTTIMAVMFLKESLPMHRVLSLIAGFVGMLIIIQPGFSTFESATLLVVAAAFCWSITDIMIKVLCNDHHAVVNTFFFALFSSLCTLPLAVYFWKMPSLENMAWLLMLAGVFVVNIISVTKSYENADLTIIMPFTFSQLIFVAVLSYIAFGQVMSFSTLVGSVVIIGSTSYIAYRERGIR
jgi:drug/metabolite transporter (DMT)-like permease